MKFIWKEIAFWSEVIALLKGLGITIYVLFVELRVIEIFVS